MIFLYQRFEFNWCPVFYLANPSLSPQAWSEAWDLHRWFTLYMILMWGSLRSCGENPRSALLGQEPLPRAAKHTLMLVQGG